MTNIINTHIPLSTLLGIQQDRLDACFIKGVVTDSRAVKPGFLFIARQGVHLDATGFIGHAIKQGAVAILQESTAPYIEERSGVVYVYVTNLLQCAGQVISRFFGDPSSTMQVIGITGTNGKTSCTHFVAQALASMGTKAAVIGTIGNGMLGQLTSATHTTPEVASLHALLADFKHSGVQSVAMEVSSHALDQGRTEGVQFSIVGLTNLTRDHLDYHETMDAYAESKSRLFQNPAATQILNLDDPLGQKIIDETTAKRRYTYSLHDRLADIYLINATQHAHGMTLSIASPWGVIEFESRLMGQFNISNLMLTLGVLGELGLSAQAIAYALRDLNSVCGRLEKVSEHQEFSVFVDYAHTPDALEQTLKALSEHQSGSGRIICVFGCGGDRDKGKRPLMAQVASTLADVLIITSDNPRTEDPLQILHDIEVGVKPHAAQHLIEVDRARAIYRGVELASAGDIVLIAGKGHESYQEIKGIRLHFSDQEVARAALALEGRLL